MNDSAFDLFVRRAATGMSRRSSLLALGGAAMTVAAAKPDVVGAAKGGKKARRKCKKQRRQCRQVVSAVCADAAFPPLCLESFLACCDPLRRCDADAAVRCLFVLQ